MVGFLWWLSIKSVIVTKPVIIRTNRICRHSSADFLRFLRIFFWFSVFPHIRITGGTLKMEILDLELNDAQ